MIAEFGALLVKAVLPGVATVAGGYLVGLLHKALKAKGVELTDAQDARIRQIVTDAIMRVEEVGRRNPGMSPTAKESLATLYIQDSVTHLAPEDIQGWIESVLPAVRAQLQRATPASIASIPR